MFGMPPNTSTKILSHLRIAALQAGGRKFPYSWEPNNFRLLFIQQKFFVMVVDVVVQGLRKLFQLKSKAKD